jgi:hypothetical protein
MSRAELIAELLELNRRIGGLLEAMGPSPEQRDYLEYRAQIGRLQAKFDELNNELSSMLGLSSAKARMLAYLELHVGEVVSKEELGGVAGIFEFQRRLRELRQDEGYQISSMETHGDLRPGEYVLVSKDRLTHGEQVWDTARRVRTRKMPPGARLVALLQDIAPAPATPQLVLFALDGDDLADAIAAARESGHHIICEPDLSHAGQVLYRLGR